MNDFLDRVRRIELDGQWWDNPTWEADGKTTPEALNCVLPILRRVFPSVWFRETPQHPFRKDLTAGGIVPTSRLAALGADLAILYENSRFASLLERLKNPDGFEGAEFELRVLSRIFATDPTAEPYPVLSSGRRAEARIRNGNRSLLVEAKTLMPPSNDKVFSYLHAVLFKKITPLNLERIYRLEWELTDRGTELAETNLSRLKREWAHAVDELVDQIRRSPLGERGNLAAGGLLRVTYYPRSEGRFNTCPGFPLKETVGISHLFRRLVSDVRDQLVTAEPTLLCVRLLRIWPPLSKTGLEYHMGKGPKTPTYMFVENTIAGHVLARHPSVELPDENEDLLSVAVQIPRSAAE